MRIWIACEFWHFDQVQFFRNFSRILGPWVPETTSPVHVLYNAQAGRQKQLTIFIIAWLVMYIIEGDSPLNTKHFHIRFETLHWHCNVLHTELSTCAKRMTMFHYIHYYKSTCILRLCQDLVQAQIVAHPG